MAELNCNACEEIRQADPNLIINGFTDTECASLMNNTGLNPSAGHDDCTDLNLMNDCFIGNMEKEVNAYDSCDWKKFAKDFIRNLHTVLKAIICAICGIWQNIQNIWKDIQTLFCRVDYLAEGYSIRISEDDTDQSYIVAGKGISFLGTGTGARESQVTLLYIGGGLVRVGGSLLFNKNNFTDASECYNYDTDGVNPRKSTSRLGNSYWNNTLHVASSGGVNYYGIRTMVSGGELLYEIRVSKEQYPFIKGLFAGIAAPTGGGMYQITLSVFSAGEYAYGQHGNCNERGETPAGTSYEGHSKGHLVPDGWIYVQARMINIGYLNADNVRYSPRGFMGIRLDSKKMDC